VSGGKKEASEHRGFLYQGDRQSAGGAITSWRSRRVGRNEPSKTQKNMLAPLIKESKTVWEEGD